MTRNHSIDAYRGIAIFGMIFFTVILRLSDTLPDVLRHNVWGAVHVGDFILPMFLFASGFSLAYFFEKEKFEIRKEFVNAVVKRFLLLAFVGVSLSYFSAYGFLEMDEVLLSALLFIGCAVLYRFKWASILGIVLVINLSYVVLMQLNFETIFIGHYLGGYPAALYYLPVMLIGLSVGKGHISKGLWCKENNILIGAIFVFFLVFSVIIPFNKMTASPSFMMLAILFSYLLYIMVDSWCTSFSSLIWLQKIGRKPLRYWILMFLLFLVPLSVYGEISGQSLPFSIQWYYAIGVSGVIIILFYTIACISEYLTISK